jgi:hypothetical protein
MAGDLAPRTIVVGERAEIVAVVAEIDGAFEGQDLQAMFCQLEVADDLGAEQAADVRA